MNTTINKLAVEHFEYKKGLEVIVAGGLARAATKNRVIQMKLIADAILIYDNKTIELPKNSLVYVLEESWSTNPLMNKPYTISNDTKKNISNPFFLVDKDYLVGYNS